MPAGEPQPPRTRNGTPQPPQRKTERQPGSNGRSERDTARRRSHNCPERQAAGTAGERGLPEQGEGQPPGMPALSAGPLPTSICAASPSTVKCARPCGACGCRNTRRRRDSRAAGRTPGRVTTRRMAVARDEELRAHGADLSPAPADRSGAGSLRMWVISTSTPSQWKRRERRIDAVHESVVAVAVHGAQGV